jgi:hypothetical protein
VPGPYSQPTTIPDDNNLMRQFHHEIETLIASMNKEAQAIEEKLRMQHSFLLMAIYFL